MSYSIINISGLSGVAAGTVLLTVPVTIDTYGSNTKLLGTPVGWIDFSYSGVVRKIPYY